MVKLKDLLKENVDDLESLTSYVNAKLMNSRNEGFARYISPNMIMVYHPYGWLYTDDKTATLKYVSKLFTNRSGAGFKQIKTPANIKKQYNARDIVLFKFS